MGTPPLAVIAVFLFQPLPTLAFDVVRLALDSPSRSCLLRHLYLPAVYTCASLCPCTCQAPSLIALRNEVNE